MVCQLHHWTLWEGLTAQTRSVALAVSPNSTPSAQPLLVPGAPLTQHPLVATQEDHNLLDLHVFPW